MKKRSTHTKRALAASLLSLVLCAAILLGTTLAWFTDSVTNTQNTIQTGNLQVALASRQLDLTGDAQYSPVATDGSEAGRLFSDVLWEPGKANGADLKVTNDGNLALKWELRFSNLQHTDGIADDGIDANIADVLDVYVIGADDGADALVEENKIGTLSSLSDGFVAAGMLKNNGASESFAVVLKMQETADNTYKNAGVTFNLELRATQATEEKDGFGNDQYDALADGTPDYDWGASLSGSVTKPVVPNEDTILTLGGATFVVPSDAVDTNANEISVKIVPTAKPDDLVVDMQTQEHASYDITMSGIAQNNTTPIQVSLYIGKELSDVKVYHANTEIPSSYDGSTGYVKFETTSFSPFTVVWSNGFVKVSNETELRDALSNQKNVILDSSLVLSSNVEFSYDAVLDFNGNDLTINNGAGSVKSLTNLTIQGNGTLHGAVVVSQKANLVINAGESFSVESNFITGAAISANLSSNVEINGGNYTSKQKGAAVLNLMGENVVVRDAVVDVGVASMSQSAGIDVPNAASTVLENVTVNAGYSTAVQLNGSMYTGSAKIVGGTFTTDRVAEGWNPNPTIQYGGTLDISNATVNRVGVGILYRRTWPAVTSIEGLTTQDLTFQQVNDTAAGYKDIDFK